MGVGNAIFHTNTRPLRGHTPFKWPNLPHAPSDLRLPCRREMSETMSCYRHVYDDRPVSKLHMIRDFEVIHEPGKAKGKSHSQLPMPPRLKKDIKNASQNLVYRAVRRILPYGGDRLHAAVAQRMRRVSVGTISISHMFYFGMRMAVATSTGCSGGPKWQHTPVHYMP